VESVTRNSELASDTRDAGDVDPPNPPPRGMLALRRSRTWWLVLAVLGLLAVPSWAQTTVEVECISGETNPFEVRILVEIDDVPTFCDPGGVDASFFIAWTDPFPESGGDFVVHGTQIPPCQPFNICPWSLSAGSSTKVRHGSLEPVCPPIHGDIAGWVDHWFNEVTVSKARAGTSPPCTAADFPEEFCGDAILQEGEDCDDGNTLDGDCCSTACTFEAAGTICGVTDACTTPATCDGAGQCVPGEPIVCDDGDVCNGVEVCELESGCQPGTPLRCDDGVFCNGAETCEPDLGCVPGPPPDCGDPDGCTVDFCDTELDQCQNIRIPRCELPEPKIPCGGIDCAAGNTDPCTVRFCNPDTDQCEDLEAPDCPPEPPCDGDPCLTDHPCIFRYCDPIADECMEREIADCVPSPPPVETPVPATVPPPPLSVITPGGQPISVLFGGSVGPGNLVSRFTTVPLSGISLGPVARATSGAGAVQADDPDPLSSFLVLNPAPFWALAFLGPYEPPVELALSYDPAATPPEVSEGDLAVFQWKDGVWQLVGGRVDTATDVITVTVEELSLFVVGSSVIFGDDFETGDTSEWSRPNL